MNLEHFWLFKTKTIKSSVIFSLCTCFCNWIIGKMKKFMGIFWISQLRKIYWFYICILLNIFLTILFTCDIIPFTWAMPGSLLEHIKDGLCMILMYVNKITNSEIAFFFPLWLFIISRKIDDTLAKRLFILLKLPFKALFRYSGLVMVLKLKLCWIHLFCL